MRPSHLLIPLILALPARAAVLDVQAHRGAGELAPQETISAFRKGIAIGATTLELDLQVSADGVLVVHHDQDLDPRRCRHADGGRPERRLIRDIDWAELTTIECAPGEPLLRFRQVLALARSAARPVFLNVEIKMQDERRGVDVLDFAKAVVQEVTRERMADRVLVQSFSTEALREVRRLAPTLPTSVLVRNRADYQRAVDESSASVLSPRRDDLRREDVQRFHAQGIVVIPWVVNDEEEMRRFMSWGVDGLITDRPDLAVALRDRPEQVASNR